MLGGFVMEKQNRNETEKQDGKDQNIDLTILNETAKAAKMGLDSIHYLEEKISNPEMKKPRKTLILRGLAEFCPGLSG